MKIYLASRYSRYKEMQTYREQLERYGHFVTSRWINGNHQLSDGELSDEAAFDKRVQFAEEDTADLMNSECVIAFTEEPRKSNSRGGRHVEFGIALATGKRIMVVGHRENVFYYLRDVEFFTSWDAALMELGDA